MTRSEQEQHQIISKKCRICLTASLGLVLSLGLIKMVLSNQASSWGHNLNSLKLETEALKKQNLQLQSDLAKQAGGLEDLSNLAKQKGFTDKPNFKYFTSGPSVAQVLP